MKHFFIRILFSVSLGLSLLAPSYIDAKTPTTFERYKKATTVYVTKTGAKYHLGSCSYLRQSKISTNKAKAIKEGYTACSRCKP